MGGPPDVHYEVPSWPYSLSLVGLKDLKAVARIRLLSGDCATLLVSMDAFTDLPASVRGSNMSRSAKTVLGSLEGCGDPWEVLEHIASTLLSIHEYATRAVVSLKLSLPDSAEQGISYRLAFAVSRERGGAYRYVLKASTFGMTACPSALAVSRWAGGEGHTHTQRAVLIVKVECSSPPRIDGGFLEALKSSFSAVPKAYLTRDAEGKFVAEAFSSPMFTEDVTRKALHEVAGYMGRAGARGCCVKAIGRSYESVHPFDIVARGALCW